MLSSHLATSIQQGVPQLPRAGSGLLSVATAVCGDGHGMSSLFFSSALLASAFRGAAVLRDRDCRNFSTCVAVAGRFSNRAILFAFEVEFGWHALLARGKRRLIFNDTTSWTEKARGQNGVLRRPDTIDSFYRHGKQHYLRDPIMCIFIIFGNAVCMPRHLKRRRYNDIEFLTCNATR